MRTFHGVTSTFCIASVGTILAACGGAGTGGAVPPAALSHATLGAPKGSMTFQYTGAKQTFMVPSGVTTIHIHAYGAAGSTSPDSGAPGGNGGLTVASVLVTPGKKLFVFVGGQNGFNGGGGSPAPGANGGGASDIRAGGVRFADRIVIAGGGGAGGTSCGVTYCINGGQGGAGGGSVGASGQNGSYGSIGGGGGGAGGSQTAGGAGGYGGGNGSCYGYVGHNGRLAKGGKGGTGLCAGEGGGGGGGYYGGGGGGGGGYYQGSYSEGGGGGGGGGSSYVEKGATHVKDIQGGGSAADGKVIITW